MVHEGDGSNECIHCTEGMVRMGKQNSMEPKCHILIFCCVPGALPLAQKKRNSVASKGRAEGLSRKMTFLLLCTRTQFFAVFLGFSLLHKGRGIFFASRGVPRGFPEK